MTTRQQSYTLEDLQIEKAQLREQLLRKRSRFRRMASGLFSRPVQDRSSLQNLVSFKTVSRIAGAGAFIIRGVMLGAKIARTLRKLVR